MPPLPPVVGQRTIWHHGEIYMGHVISNPKKTAGSLSMRLVSALSTPFQADINWQLHVSAANEVPSVKGPRSRVTTYHGTLLTV